MACAQSREFLPVPQPQAQGTAARPAGGKLHDDRVPAPRRCREELLAALPAAYLRDATAERGCGKIKMGFLRAVFCSQN